MKMKRTMAIILCLSMLGQTLTGCGIFSSKREGEEKINIQTKNNKITLISEEFDDIEEDEISSEVNMISSQKPNKKKETEDLVTTLIDKHLKEDEENQKDKNVVTEKDPEHSVDQPFDVAYPDIFNSEDVEYADNAILVKVDKDYSKKTVDGLKAAKVGKMEVMFELEEHAWYVAYLLKGADVHEAMEQVRNVSGVETAEYNFKYETALSESASMAEAEVAENDKYGNQWPKDKFGIREGWGAVYDKLQTGGGKNNVIVAVIDTGVDYTHPDLKANIWKNTAEVPENGMDDDGNGYIDDYYGVDTTADCGSGMDDNGHGTHVAGIVAASNNKEGVVGYAYNAKIMPVKAGDASGYFLQNNVVEAIYYAYENGADVINMSFGGSASSIAVQDALALAYSRCVLVASAGNDGAHNEGLFAIPNYPAAFKYVLGVMSVDQKNTESAFTNYDVNAFNSVEYEVYAPGEQMLSTLPNGRYGVLSGTSMAAPVVAAQAALLRSYYADTNTYPTKFIYGQIVGTADDEVSCFDEKLHGLHNIPGVVNFYDSFTELPTPDVGMSDYTLFDTVEFKADDKGIASDSKKVNNGDGIVDAGEIIALGFTLKNRWGMADNVKVSIDATNDMSVENPYVTFLNNNITYDSIGTYSENDCGKIYDESSDGKRWIGWENPFYIKISEKCPNDYTVTFNIHIDCENGLNEKDNNSYSSTEQVVLKIRRGTELPNKIYEDMTLTKDNYYIIPNATIIGKGATVTVEAGTQIQFWCSDPEDAYADTAITYLRVEGNLICKGTEEEPVEIFPSEWMSEYVVQIDSVNGGHVSLEHTKVTNPVLNIEEATNCEFIQNYKRHLLYKGLYNGTVQTWSRNGETNIDLAKDCAYYKVGGSNEHYLFSIVGKYDRCIFVDSAIQYGAHEMSRCVFYGNNNYWDADKEQYGSGEASSIMMGGNSQKLVVKQNFRNEDTGKTYMVLDGAVNKRSMSKFIGLMGGDIASFNDAEELNYVFKHLAWNQDDYEEKYNSGLYVEDDTLYNNDGSKVVISDSNIEYVVIGASEDGKTYGLQYRGGADARKIINVTDKIDYRNMITEIPGTIYITKIKLEDYVVDLDIDSKYTIAAMVTPIAADATTLLYESQDESVVKVDENGTITPIAEGSTTVRVYAPDYAVYNYVTVNVLEPVELEGISTFSDEIVMNVDSEQKLNLKFTPAATTRRHVTYESADETIVSVNKKGMMKALKEGETEITVTGENNISTTVKVKVIVPVQSVTFAKDMYVTTLDKEETHEFYPTITPMDATHQSLTWESSNPEVCYVDENGDLVKLKTGYAMLKASIKEEGISDTLEINITEAASDSEIIEVSGRFGYSERYALTSDGSLWKWGGSLEYSYPVKLPIEGVKDFLAYDNTYYVLCEDGNVYYYDREGNVSKKIATGDVVALSTTTNDVYFAITSSGGVWAWGWNPYGQLGIGDTSTVYTPKVVNINEDVVKVVSIVCGTVFLTAENDVYYSGSGTYLEPVKIASDVTDVYPVSEYHIALEKDSIIETLYASHDGYRYPDRVENKVNESYAITDQASYYIENGKVYQYTGGATEILCDEEITPKKLYAVNNNVYILSGDNELYAYGAGSGYKLGNGRSEDSNKLIRVYLGIQNNDGGLNFERGYVDPMISESGALLEDRVVLDFDQALLRGGNFSSIELKDENGSMLVATKELDLDKLIIRPKNNLEFGKTYTVTVAGSALKERSGAVNEEVTFTFEYLYEYTQSGNIDSGDTEVDTEEPVVNETVVDNDKVSQRHRWTSDEVQEIWKKFVADGHNTAIYSSAILNRLNDDDTSSWLRFTASNLMGSPEDYVVNLGGNYWGTTDSFLINKQILDFDDYQSLTDINEGEILTEAPDDTYPFVVNAYLKLDDEVVDTVGNDLVTFVVEFNRDMDTSIDLNVFFGSSYPFKDYEVEGEYVNARTWEGQLQLTTIIENGYQYWSVRDGKAAGTSLKLYEDLGRFPFKIDTSSAQALTMQAEPTKEGIQLSWEQDDFTTLAGYNVYRATKEDGQYTKLNRTVIPSDTKEWFDDTVEPGQRYYYNFTVVQSDMKESEPSGKVQVTAMDTMAPDIYHSPVYQAFAGNKLVISATVTDNVGISQATVFYRVTGTEEWKSVDMTNNNDKYSAVISGEFVTLAGLEYYIDATDGITHTLKGSSKNPFVVMIQEPVDESQKGDVDGNGAIELKDALMVLMAINDRVNLTETQFVKADLDGSGELEAHEALRIIQYVNGTISSVLP